MAHADLAAATMRYHDAATRVEEQENEAVWAREDLTAALAERDRAAADTALPADHAGLGHVREALTSYRQAVTELVTAAHLHTGRLTELATWAAELVQAQRGRDRMREAESAATRDGPLKVEHLRSYATSRAGIWSAIMHSTRGLTAHTGHLPTSLEVPLEALPARAHRICLDPLPEARCGPRAKPTPWFW
ncbi:hypothetical protein [Nonomuraea sp. NPDC049758]|uniref:hypothetical protein n=1 Tax=Nonomuraea sp. NPDC049758 TaxID=3154360 RepID=UPI00342831DD